MAKYVEGIHLTTSLWRWHKMAIKCSTNGHSRLLFVFWWENCYTTSLIKYQSNLTLSGNVQVSFSRGFPVQNCIKGFQCKAMIFFLLILIINVALSPMLCKYGGMPCPDECLPMSRNALPYGSLGWMLWTFYRRLTNQTKPIILLK